MTNSELIQLIILILLILLSAYFSSAETSLMSTNEVRMKAMAEEGDRRAGVVLRVLGQPSKMLSAILIGNNIVNLTASALTTVLVTNLFGSMAVGIATGVLTIIILIAGEILPKTVASIRPEQVARAYGPSILFLMRVLTPVIFLVNVMANGLMRLFRIDPNQKSLMTENELKTYVDVSTEDGVIEDGEKEMILNVFDFGDAVTKDVMIPRIDMCCVDAEATFAEIESIFRKTMYTRIPVYEDNPDNIIGLVNIKDLFLVGDRVHFRLKDHLREAYYTYEYKKTSDLLEEMRRDKKSIAFVLSEYGATVGMITLEDLLEEIVGEIRDEYDSDEEELIRDLGDGRFLLDGSLKLSDVNDALHTDFESEDYDSIGGLMIEHLDRLPHNRETVTLPHGEILSARAVSQHRVKRVLLTLPAAGAADAE